MAEQVAIVVDTQQQKDAEAAAMAVEEKVASSAGYEWDSPKLLEHAQD